MIDFQLTLSSRCGVSDRFAPNNRCFVLGFVGPKGFDFIFCFMYLPTSMYTRFAAR